MTKGVVASRKNAVVPESRTKQYMRQYYLRKKKEREEAKMGAEGLWLEKEKHQYSELDRHYYAHQHSYSNQPPFSGSAHSYHANYYAHQNFHRSRPPPSEITPSSSEISKWDVLPFDSSLADKLLLDFLCHEDSIDLLVS